MHLGFTYAEAEHVLVSVLIVTYAYIHLVCIKINVQSTCIQMPYSRKWKENTFYSKRTHSIAREHIL